jgi:hypothetical protein
MRQSEPERARFLRAAVSQAGPDELLPMHDISMRLAMA